jgi:tetratricopeptide (TPR) repeat protein
MGKGRRPPRAQAPVDASPAAGVDALCRQAIALHQQGRLTEAEALYRQVLARRPRHTDALQYTGVIAHQQGRHEEALLLIDKALKADPRNAFAHSNRGMVLQALGRNHDALESYERALCIRPGYAEAHYNRGNALRELDRPADALASYDKALAARPDYLNVFVNRGGALISLGRLQEAQREFARALALDAQHPVAHLNSAIASLTLGDFAAGLPEFEWRWREDQLKSASWNRPEPLWLGGETLDGRTLLLHAEQGLGDTIQFCRYAPALAARGARVVIEVQPALTRLMRTLNGVTEVIGRGDALPPFDLHTPLLSLPLAFGTRIDTIPRAQAYLAADDEAVAVWRDRLGEKSGLRVGLVWSGSTGHRNDRHRSIPLQAIAAVLAKPGIELVSLQKDLRPPDRAVLDTRTDIRRFEDELGDFADTAALIACMDIVITVDTAPAHLAAALGKPVWILLPFAADWRWLRDRDDTPWYPTARLFRQPAIGDWDSVLQRVASEI